MRKKKADPAKGIYLRHETYWIRYSVAGTQYRVNLKTGDLREAIDKAAKVRGSVPREGKPIAWDAAVEAYIKTKEEQGKFEAWTASRTRSALNQFQKWSNARSPHLVTKEVVQDFYTHLAETKSEATARTYAARAAIFLGHIHGEIWHLDYNSGNQVRQRDLVVPHDLMWDLIFGARRDDLSFVLMAGFMAGMRLKEIVMARPSWFRISAGEIAIPARERQMTADGPRIFKTKSGRSRKIPLHAMFAQWIQDNVDPKALYILHPNQASKPYRWDPKRPFKDYMRKMKVPEVTFHTMRHTFISHLANSGKFTSMQVSAWSGDRIQTIEKHYFHSATPKGALDDAFITREMEEREEAWVKENMEPEDGTPEATLKTLADLIPQFMEVLGNRKP